MGRKHRRDKEWTLNHIEEKYRAKAYRELKRTLRLRYSSKRYVLIQSHGFKPTANLGVGEIKDIREEIARLEWKLEVFYKDYPEYCI